MARLIKMPPSKINLLTLTFRGYVTLSMLQAFRAGPHLAKFPTLILMNDVGSTSLCF